MARKKRKSPSRGRGGRFKKSKSRRKARKSSRRKVRKLARGLYRVNPAKGGKKRKSRRKGRKARKGGRGPARSKRKKRKSGKGRARRMGTKRLQKMLRARGYAVKPKGKKRKSGSKRKRKTGTRTRVARHMAAANRHKTYPLMNPSRRRRRKARRNPARRTHRAHRRYRRNPSIGGLVQLAKRALPVMAGMIVGRLVTKQIASRVTALSKLGQFQGTAMSIGMLLLGGVITNKVKALGKHRDAIMLGLGINAVTEVLSMIPQVKGFLGLGEGIYDRALSDYVTTNDYLTTGATPIDDDIALSDYITTGGIEEELGLSEELGVSEELGAIDAGTVPGGVSQLSMIKQVPHQSFMEEVPARSFSKEVPHAGQGYDNPGALYAGIFRGGF